MLESNLYLAALVLSGRSALVVGAGRIAFEKIQGLLICDARVTVVAPEAVTDVRDLSDDGAIEWLERPYDAADLEDRFLVIAATSDSLLNRRVFEDAEERAMLVNVVDVPALCNFILPAVHREGPLAVAISTAGASPALAKRMKKEAAGHFGEEYARLARVLDGLREWAKASLPTYEDRREFFESLVNGEPDPIELLAKGDEEGVRALIERAQERVGQSR